MTAAGGAVFVRARAGAHSLVAEHTAGQAVPHSHRRPRSWRRSVNRGACPRWAEQKHVREGPQFRRTHLAKKRRHVRCDRRPHPDLATDRARRLGGFSRHGATGQSIRSRGSAPGQHQRKPTADQRQYQSVAWTARAPHRLADIPVLLHSRSLPRDCGQMPLARSVERPSLLARRRGGDRSPRARGPASVRGTAGRFRQGGSLNFERITACLVLALRCCLGRCQGSP